MKNKELIIICLLVPTFLTGCQAATHSSSQDLKNRARFALVPGNVCLDNNNGLMWQTEASGSFSDWQQARQYTEQLDFAAHNDWRLPTYEQLQILRQTLDMKRQGNCPIKMKGSLWTGNSAKNARAGFWDSEPSCGGPTYFFIKRSSGSVLAVRSSKSSHD